MVAAITTAVNPKAMWPGVKKWFGKDYDEYTPQWPDLFQTEPSDKQYEEVVESVGFGLAVVKPQGGATQFDQDRFAREAFDVLEGVDDPQSAVHHFMNNPC